MIALMYNKARRAVLATWLNPVLPFIHFVVVFGELQCICLL